jgi:two-component system sensor histidine kinase ChvG
MRSRLFLKILSVVVLVLILPVAGIWSLGVFEQELLVSAERTLSVQAGSLAAGLARDDGPTAETARALLARVERPLAGRVRIYGAAGELLADTARATAGDRDAGEPSGVRDTALYRIGAALWRWRRSLFPAAKREAPRSPGDEAPLREALGGRYGALTRSSVDGETLVMTVAVPIRRGDAVAGAVLASRTTETVLAALDRIRVDLFRVVLFSLGAAALIVLVLARGLVLPLRRLRDAADGVLARPEARPAPFPGAERPDEIGDLARALGRLNGRLESRLDELEAFASDVAHELRNPLAAARSASELLRSNHADGESRALTAIITAEISRIEKVVAALQELARLDAERASAPRAALEAGGLVARVAEGFLARGGIARRIEVQRRGECWIEVPEESAARVVENLLENAISFTPAGGCVRLGVGARQEAVEITVDDEGPGVPEEHRERIFDRFFTWRPAAAGEPHLGLGLGIARAIAERYGGTISLDPDRPTGGARFRVRWPAAAAGPLQR